MSKVISTDAIKSFVDHQIFMNEMLEMQIGVYSPEALKENIRIRNLFLRNFIDNLDDHAIDLYDLSKKEKSA